MTTPPPDAVPLVVAHDAAGADAVARFAAAQDRPFVILFSPALALGGGPKIALAMRPDALSTGVICALDCADDFSVARAAILAGWTHVVVGEMDTALAAPLASLAADRRAVIWSAEALFSSTRPALNLDGIRDAGHALQKVFA